MKELADVVLKMNLCELPTHVKTMGGFYAPFYKLLGQIAALEWVVQKS